MPSKSKRIERTVVKLPSIPKELVSHFLSGPMTGEAINAAGAAFKKALIEAALNAELSHHLGYEPGEAQPEGTTNHRNGMTANSVLTGDGRLPVETPRDRDGSFEPVLIPKHARRFTGFDDKVIALYARGLTVREIQGFPAGDLWHRGQCGLRQHGHGRHSGGGDGLAEPPAGGDLSGGVL